jgi:hypothetical protein
VNMQVLQHFLLRPGLGCTRTLVHQAEGGYTLQFIHVQKLQRYLFARWKLLLTV